MNFVSGIPLAGESANCVLNILRNQELPCRHRGDGANERRLILHSALRDELLLLALRPDKQRQKPSKSALNILKSQFLPSAIVAMVRSSTNDKRMLRQRKSLSIFSRIGSY